MPLGFCSRRAILQPLAQKYSGTQYLKRLGLVTVVAVVIIIYAVIAMQWMHRTGSFRTVVTKALESAGLVKKKARKLV